mgnify:CR=1 FL=1|tara:strand:- start:898 stop:1977 length:1080 start_codon:yes stop_codon:yes gene_type:complete
MLNISKSESELESKEKQKQKFVLKCCKSKLYNGGRCRCNEILVIQRFIKKCNNVYKNLETINYNKQSICYKDIYVFDMSNRNTNDLFNKKREGIICGVINKQIPESYYKCSFLWNKLKCAIHEFVSKLCKANNIENIDKCKCEQKAGRTHNYDFNLNINDRIFNLEFKFNASNIDETPQFVSPMKPSQYLEESYEEYYYDNFLSKLVKEYNFKMPDRSEYLNKIHNPTPECVLPLQEKYYYGCKKSSKYTCLEEDINFYNRAKQLSEESIKSFIKNYNLEIDRLTNYLLKTQKNKYYMLYKNGKIYLQQIDLDNYVITSFEKDYNKQRYIATTKTDKKMKILLRWKNGNGIAYPAFQIS